MTKNLTNFITSFLVLILLTSCLNKQSEKEFNESVFYEIVPSLIDSLGIGIILTKPPPPMPIFDKEIKLIGIDSTRVFENNKEYKKRLSELKSDSIEIAVAINKIAFKLNEETKERLVEHFENENIEFGIKKELADFEITIEKLNLKNQVFNLKLRSEFPENLEIRKSQNGIFLNGELLISKIEFDKSNSFGILTASYNCGKLCGAGFDVFINKVDNKWRINQINNTWVE